MTNTEIKTKNQPKKRAANIQVDKLRTFEGHPFKVLDDEDMGNLIESIRQQGILSPLIVRTVESADEYEVISGHRRLHAAVKAGLSEVPALIYPLGRNEAMIAVVDSNLHRERILPSEKAFAYKMKMDAMKASPNCLTRLTRALSHSAPPWSCPTSPKNSRKYCLTQ